MRKWMLVIAVATIGCSETTWQQRQPTASDQPFGGGFAAADRPGYREPPFDPNSRRTEVRPVWRRDNGAAETRVGGSSAPDARIGTAGGAQSK
jgi:hypothetical protein